MIVIENPFPLFSDNNGELLESGYIYIGEAGLNPETNPINVFWDKDLLYPAAQPIRTINGLPSRDGTATPLYTASLEYSLMVKDKNQAFVNSIPDYSVAVPPADDSITVAMYTTAAYPVLLVDAQTAAGDKTWTGKTANQSTTPTYELEETGVTTDNKIWQLIASAEQFIFRVANDAKDAFASIFTVNRTGTTVDTVDFLSTNIKHNSVDMYAAIDEDDMSSDSAIRVPTQQSVKAYVDASTPDTTTIILPIGAWDMVASTGISLNHGLGQAFVTIRNISIIIRSDVNNIYYNIDSGIGATIPGPQGSINNITNAGVGFTRLTGGWFDSTNFDLTEYNLNVATAVDKGGGLVGIAITANTFSVGDITAIAGTTNYDATYIIVSQTVNEIVVAATYVAESFGGTETASWSRGWMTINYVS